MGRRLNACSGFWRGIFHSPTTLSLLLPRQGFYHDRFVLSPHFGSDRAISLPLFSGRRVFSLSPLLVCRVLFQLGIILCSLYLQLPYSCISLCMLLCYSLAHLRCLYASWVLSYWNSYNGYVVPCSYLHIGLASSLFTPHVVCLCGRLEIPDDQGLSGLRLSKLYDVIKYFLFVFFSPFVFSLVFLAVTYVLSV